MNKVIQINLGGLPFTFDDAAYHQLDDYLARLDGYFRGSPGHREIMSDIESRLAELFGQGTKGRTIVSESDVAAAIATLGQPEDLTGSVADPEAEATYARVDHRHARREERRHGDGYNRYGRRLMRDPEDKVVSGVCSGVAAYFGVDDPLWVRIGFAVAVFGFGVGLLPYIILWIVMPQARTAADRLAMRGEPLDLEHISRQVEYEATNFGERVREWGDEVKEYDWKGSFADFGKGKRRGRSAKGSRAGSRKRYSDEGYVS